MAVAALVLLVVADGDAEGDEAASEPAAHEAEDQTEDPGEGALVLIDVSHASLLAVLARDCHRVVGPVTRRVDRHALRWHHHDGLHHGLAGGRLTLHRLTLHHGLLHGLGVGLLGSVLRLGGGLRGIAGLRLLHEGLLLGHAGGCGGAVVDRFAFHLCCAIYNLKKYYFN